MNLINRLFRQEGMGQALCADAAGSVRGENCLYLL